MPELPEVETVRRGLEKYLVGHTITGVEVKLRKLVSGDTQNVIGGKIKGVRRAGKGLIIDLDNGYSVAIHIKLTGQLIYQGPDSPKLKLSEKVGGQLPNKWTHVIFRLDKNAFLYYNDLRQFGWIKIVKTDEIKNLPFFRELGPEPLVTGSSSWQAPLTLEKFREIVSRASTKIKPLLMDQKKIGGVGNIYANDALWLAGIDPRRTAKGLTPNEQSKLYNAILEVLKKGLAEGGASELNYVNALGQEGGYQKYFLVYGQEGQPCPKKHGLIQKIYLAGRGTYFCPACQR
ncbi:bifunctional DNA-formamidopyrimidine glycosylase/DNA-(apurinic or apyrimidinic site) lyase [Candidatus Microgenomates bacterium]|nr:bifunctional DNA-formamidopyrimidine glycosylase/DNA-(apurinic or apyrimidinic site) lyase [Candidatus Microgenomates bacterium]